MELQNYNNSFFQRKKDYLLRNIKKVPFLVPVDWEIGHLPPILRLNEVGVTIWNLLIVKKQILEIVQEISAEYQISQKDVIDDVLEFLFQLLEAGAVTVDGKNNIPREGSGNNNPKDFLYRIIEEDFLEVNLPLSLTWEVTHQCNLSCVHCYVANCEKQNQQRILSLEMIYDLVEQIAKIGCLQVIVTGGEPFFRKDALEIFSKFKRHGIFYLLYTNGTLINEDLVDSLRKCPPIKIELSIYGFTEETYETITRQKGSYKKFKYGLKLLLDGGFDLSLKSIAMKQNYHEIDAMREFAKDLGIEFRFDAFITSKINGSYLPIKHRLSSERIVFLEKQNTIFRSDVSNMRENFSVPTLYKCGAGKYEGNIDPYGHLSLCLLDRYPFYDLRHGSFRQGWKFITKLREMPYPVISQCLRCEIKSFCKICPGWLKIEKQPLDGKVEFLCEISKQRSISL